MSLPGSLPAVAAAAVASRRKRLIAAFRTAGAVSEDTARNAEELGVRKASVMFQIQKGRGVIVETADGRFYLDEAAEQRAERLRRKLVLATVIVVAALMLLAIAGFG